MASAASEGRTETATPKKREDERKKGNIFQSADVVSAFSIFAVFLALKLALPYAYRYLSNFFIRFVAYGKTVPTLGEDFALDACREAMAAVLLVAAPVLAAAVLAATVATGAQTRFKFSREHIKFKLSNISPLQGIRRLFSLRSVMELVKSVVKTAVIGYILYVQMKGICNRCIAMMSEDVMQATVSLLGGIMDLVIRISAVFLAMAALDYLYRWWEYERNIRMTKQEVKEEYKQLEGDPEIKGRIRQQQRSMARNRMMRQVPQADVVVRNPTHFAVALKYDPRKDNAPVVLAKGQDYVALRIVEIAQQCRIPMKEDRPLARALYASTEVGREIPPEFYNALAEIMAWVYQMKKEAGSR